MAEAIGQLIGQLIGELIVSGIAALIGAVILRLAVRRVAGFTPPYGKAWLACYLGFAASLIVSSVVGLFLGAAAGHRNSTATILLMVIGF